MPQYMLSVHGTASDVMPSEDDIKAMYAAVDVFNNELQDEGAWVFAGGLLPIESSTTVDATGDKPIVTDGPFVESKEWLGGFWVLEASDLDAALELAKRGSAACGAKVEVRPFQVDPR